MMKTTKILSDAEVIAGIQHEDEKVLKSFMNSCRVYFDDKRVGAFIFQTHVMEPQDLFQEAFVTLWNEIQTGKIHLRDNCPYRYTADGVSKRMTASLKTYLMSIAKYKNMELLRDSEAYADYEPSADLPDIVEEAPERTMENLMKETLGTLPHRCQQILTLFYIYEKSYDEILKIRKENTSKDGLKTGKSKCMMRLKERVLEKCEKYHLKPYHHE